MTPDFVVIGAQRCGTTALYAALRQQPDLYMAAVKEPRFFAFSDQPPTFNGPGAERFRQETVAEWRAYQALFAGAALGQRCGEASPVYLSAYQPAQTAAAMRRLAPELRLVAILRQPADRAYSAFWHQRRLGSEPLADFRQALAAERSRLAAGWAPGFGYAANGRYAANLQPYCQQFPPEQIKVYLYDDWRQQPQTVLQDLAAFLQVRLTATSTIAAASNRSLAPRSRVLAHWLEQPQPGKQRLAHLLPLGLRRWARHWLHRWNGTLPPPLAEDLRAQLTAAFHDDIMSLENLIQRDLSAWLAPASTGSQGQG